MQIVKVELRAFLTTALDGMNDHLQSRPLYKIYPPPQKKTLYLPSLMMKVPNHLYVLGDTYTFHTLIKYNQCTF
jgi:hypothetical protein